MFSVGHGKKKFKGKERDKSKNEDAEQNGKLRKK
jgi:hypothetical protein